MSNNNIIIFEFESLYNILFEIRDNLSFKIKNLNKLSLKKEDFIKKDLIIAKYVNKDFFLKEKKIEHNKIIFFSKEKENTRYQIITYPIEIKNLIEKINIKLIKVKYNNQSHLKIHNYTLDLNSRIISNKNNSLKLTEKEIEIILFLNNHNSPQKVKILQNKVWGYSLELETHTVETHIYRLRKKITGKFNDENFISSNENGYFIK